MVLALDLRNYLWEALEIAAANNKTLDIGLDMLATNIKRGFAVYDGAALDWPGLQEQWPEGEGTGPAARAFIFYKQHLEELRPIWLAWALGEYKREDVETGAYAAAFRAAVARLITAEAEYV
jgi:hypothetical protein